MMKANRKYAGFWIRVCADFVDSCLLDIASCAVGLIFLGLLYWIKIIFIRGADGNGFNLLSALSSFSVQALLVILRGGLSLVYYTWGGTIYGTSIGKRIFKVYIISESTGGPITFKQSLIRCLAYIPSYFIFSAGFLMVAFHPEKRGLHDLIAGTACVYRNKETESDEAVQQQSAEELRE